MLVLSRKADEKIQIGREITLTVIEVRGRYVRLGIDAPHGVRIIRRELLERPRPEAAENVPAGP